MATYKVIQDIEAEDKLLGPLSFRQFVYFLIGSTLAFICFTSLTRGAWPVLVVLGLPMAFCFFFAFPWTPDQPTEVWALARIRYYFKPRKRLWNQSGTKDFVTVTAPQKVERSVTDGLSQDQVRSRLEALSRTIDTRGWAVRNSYAVPQSFQQQASDRLVNFDGQEQIRSFDVHDEDDILDARNNPAAYQMGQLIDASSKAHRQQILEKLRSQAAPNPSSDWFKRQPTNGQVMNGVPAQQPAAVLPAVPATPTPAPAPTPMAATPVAAQAQPAAAAPEPVKTTPPEPTKSAPDAAILNLAHDNNMDIATLAREAKRAKAGELGDDEVVVSLH